MREACRRRAVKEASRAAAALEERWPRLRDALQDAGAIGVRAGCVETAASRAVRNQLTRSISARDATRLAEALGLACVDGSENEGPHAPPGAPPLPKDVPLPKGGLASVEARSTDSVPTSIRDLCLSAAADQEALLCWRQVEVACANENAADLRLWAEHASSLGFEVSVELLFAKCLQDAQDKAAALKEQPPELPNLHRSTPGKVSPAPMPANETPTPGRGGGCPTCGRCAFCQEDSVSKGSFSPSSPCFGPDEGDEQSHSDWRMPRGYNSSANGLDHSSRGVAPRPPAVPQPPPGIPPDAYGRDVSPPPAAPPPGARRRDMTPPTTPPPAGHRRRDISPQPGVPPGLREAPGPPPPNHDTQSWNYAAPARSSSKERVRSSTKESLPKPEGFPPPPPLPNASTRWSIHGRERPGSAKYHDGGAHTARGAPPRDPYTMNSARTPRTHQPGEEVARKGGQSRQRPSSAGGRARGRHPTVTY